MGRQIERERRERERERERERYQPSAIHHRTACHVQTGHRPVSIRSFRLGSYAMGAQSCTAFPIRKCHTPAKYFCGGLVHGAGQSCCVAPGMHTASASEIERQAPLRVRLVSVRHRLRPQNSEATLFPRSSQSRSPPLFGREGEFAPHIGAGEALGCHGRARAAEEKGMKRAGRGVPRARDAN
jgi:hypothetical protein